jgi:hypothetical protein
MKRGIKHGHMPGDVPKFMKINMLEKGYIVTPGDCDAPSERRGIKSYKKRILMKERAVLKRRFRKQLEE